MKPIDKEDTINKSILLNWLYSADKDLALPYFLGLLCKYLIPPQIKEQSFEK